MKRKTMAGIMAILMAVSGLAGCGGSGSQGNSGESSKTESSAAGAGAAIEAAKEKGAGDELAKPKGKILTAAIAAQEHEDRIGMVQPIANNDAMRGIMPGIEDLFHYNSGKVEGWLIDEWTVSEDGMEYNWHVREGVKFHDGSELTAEVVRWNLQYALDNGVTAIPIQSMEVVDSHNLKVVLSEKNPLFLDTLATGLFGFVYSQEAYEKNGVIKIRSAQVHTGLVRGSREHN